MTFPVTGATNIVDEAACLIWSELCPGTVMGDEDRTHYEAAAKAVLALSPSREAVIEECAKVCENLRHEDYPSETSEWSSGTFDCAQAIRALVSRSTPRKRPSFSPQAKRTVTIELTEQQLTDIRVSVLTRLDRLKGGDETDVYTTERYKRIRSLMDTGGPLFKAMVEIKSLPDITS